MMHIDINMRRMPEYTHSYIRSQTCLKIDSSDMYYDSDDDVDDEWRVKVSTSAYYISAY